MKLNKEYEENMKMNRKWHGKKHEKKVAREESEKERY